MEWFFDCPQCGHVGRLDELKQHDTRPMPDDFGFCPKCNSYIQDPINEQEVRALAVEYDEDPDKMLAEIAARA